MSTFSDFLYGLVFTVLLVLGAVVIASLITGVGRQ